MVVGRQFLTHTGIVQCLRYCSYCAVNVQYFTGLFLWFCHQTLSTNGEGIMFSGCVSATFIRMFISLFIQTNIVTTISRERSEQSQ